MRYFLSFGNNIFQNQLKKLGQQAIDTNWFDKVVLENPDSIKDFYLEHKSFIDSNTRGYGYWIWKPYIIHRLLSQINNDDYIFYTDAGCSIVHHKGNRLLEYIEILEKTDKPILTFSTEYSEKNFQKLSVLNSFDIDGQILSENQNFLDSYQVESGILICRKNTFVTNFIKEWLYYCLKDNYNFVTDNRSEEKTTQDFIEHRHDQSILSILCKKYDTTIICCNEAYGFGPFFSSRLTDEGQREFAPDLFRADIKYDPNKHLTWKEWLDQYPDDRFNYDILLNTNN